MNPEDDIEALRSKLAKLNLEHRDLDSAIDSLARQPASDPLQLARLKKRKLELKDRIKAIESRL